jgi:hypothetical protein
MQKKVLLLEKTFENVTGGGMWCRQAEVELKKREGREGRKNGQ